MSVLVQTCFAPAERAEPAEIERQFQLLSGNDIPLVLDSVPIISMVLNRCRQVVFGNRTLVDVVGISDIREALGLRPGEAFGCVHAGRMPGGCGTSEFCAHCGAVRSILQGLAGRKNAQECNLNRRRGEETEALDLLVTSAPFDLGGDSFLFFSITDISHENRRRALERIFFHDMLNTAGGVRGLMEFLAEEVPEALRADARLIYRAVAQLTEEIIYQKQLLAAESDELETTFALLRSADILEVVEATFQNSEPARGRRIEVRAGSWDVLFQSDQVLLRRVLGNMVKNALEATPPGGVVRLGCDAAEDSVTFWVRNDGVLSRDTRMRIFNRSFSTKGKGRGIGTYSIKLLTERYLGGSVGFESTPEAGTVFWVRLPLEPACEGGA